MVDYISDVPNAPRAIGPYSQATRVGNLYFLSGQIPLVPATGELLDGNVEAQTVQVLENIKAILTELKLDFSNVAKTTIFLANMADFQKVNAIYERYFASSKPARSTIQVAALPRAAQVEIEVIAVKE